MTSAEKAEIMQLFETALDAKMKDFYIEREKHYQHHLYIEDLMAWTNNFKNSFAKTLAKCLATLMTGIFLLGFAIWQFFKTGN